MSDFLNELVAMLHYEKGFSQQEIAEKFLLSKMAVSRILQKAKEAKIIRMSVKMPYTLNNDIGRELIKKFGITEAFVVKCASNDSTSISEKLGRMWAFYTGVGLPDDYILGLGVGQTVGQFVQNLMPMKTNNIHVVQLMGGLADVTYKNPFTIVQETCRKLHAKGTYFTSFAVVENKEVRNSLVYNTKMGQQVYDYWNRCNEALFGIGLLEKGTLRSLHMLTDEEVKRLRKEGLVGDFLGHFFTKEGKFDERELGDRLVSIPLEILKKIPRKVALAGGEEKAEVIKGALATGVIDILVTDDATGKLLRDM